MFVSLAEKGMIARAGQTITLTGDVSGAGTDLLAVSLASTGVVEGVYGSANQSTVLRVDAKGRVLEAQQVDLAPLFSNIVGLPTTLQGYGITDAASSPNSTNLEFSKTSSSLLQSEVEGRQVLCELAADKFKTVKFVIEVCYDEIVQATEVLVVSNGVVANSVEYAIINTDHNIATFDAQVIDGKLSLFVTLMHSHSTVIYHYTALTRGALPAPIYSPPY
jgi:hypothetical protein